MPETTHHGNQKVTTYYGEAKKEREFRERNDERVALNRKLRSEQTSTPVKVQQGMAFVVGGVVSGVDKVRKSPFVKGAIEKVMTRSREVAHEMQESPAKERREHRGGRRAEPYDSPMMHAPAMPRDPFGIGNMGGFGAPPRREPAAEPPRKRRKKRKASAAPRRASAHNMMDPSYVPPSMRHMF
jgi:hypothetical protein